MADKTQDLIEAQLNPRGTKVHIELPVLDGFDALRFVGLLSRIIDAVWTTYYMEMNEILREGDPGRCRFLPNAPKPGEEDDDEWSDFPRDNEWPF